MVLTLKRLHTLVPLHGNWRLHLQMSRDILTHDAVSVLITHPVRLGNTVALHDGRSRTLVVDYMISTSLSLHHVAACRRVQDPPGRTGQALHTHRVPGVIQG